MEGSDPPRCGTHGPYRFPEAEGRRCTAIGQDGSPCQGWAVRGSDPPRCCPHGGGSKSVGPPQGNQNRLKHGFYARSERPTDPSIDALIQDLYRRWLRLGDYLEQALQSSSTPVKELRNPLRLYGETASKLAKLLRQRRALSAAQAAARMKAATDQALDELSVQLGVEL
jgi:hypothetical protein